MKIIIKNVVSGSSKMSETDIPDAHFVYVTLSDGTTFSLLERDEKFLEVSVEHQLHVNPRAANSIYLSGEFGERKK